MKTTRLTLCLIIIFSIYSISSSLCAAAEEPAPVVDIDGNQVQAGVDYYILPVVRGIGGGLTLDSVGDKDCPLNVVQEPSELDNGLPLYFRPVNPNEGVVRVLTDQNFIFNASSICVQSTLWTLYFDETIGRFFVATGGVEGNPGLDTLSNWFRIEEYEVGYKLVFCPTVCDFCRPVCGDLGIFVQDSQRRLSLTQTDESPLMVWFKKV